MRWSLLYPLLAVVLVGISEFFIDKDYGTHGFSAELFFYSLVFGVTFVITCRVDEHAAFLGKTLELSILRPVFEQLRQSPRREDQCFEVEVSPRRPARRASRPPRNGDNSYSVCQSYS